jgi:type IV pilus assembly protein PilA
MLMLQRLQRRLQGEREGGFTLIELMVVVLIIAILIAIAIPTFLGARQRAQDRAAQSNLRNGLTAEKTFYTDNQAYTAAVATLEGIEAPLDWRADAVPAVNGAVYVAVNAAADQVTLGSRSASGTCFYIRDIATGATAGTTYQRGACAAPSSFAAGPLPLTTW